MRGDSRENSVSAKTFPQGLRLIQPPAHFHITVLGRGLVELLAVWIGFALVAGEYRVSKLTDGQAGADAYDCKFPSSSCWAFTIMSIASRDLRNLHVTR